MLVRADSIFKIEYGNKFDANKAEFVAEGVNFISRSSKNLGIFGKVEALLDAPPYEAGLITVTMGGTYLLSAFVQPEPFYTAQNIKVLRPLKPMSLSEKAYYCECIRANRFRYSTHGREANRSFNGLLLPERADVPAWAKAIQPKKFALKADHVSSAKAQARPKQIELVRLDALFNIRSGLLIGANARSETRVSNVLPYVRPSKTQTTSSVEYVDKGVAGTENIYPRHTLYVSTNGQGSHTYTYVSSEPFVPNTDVSVLLPKRPMSLQEKLYYAAIITSNRFRFSYGRKPKGERLSGLLVPEWAPEFVYQDNLAALIG